MFLKKLWQQAGAVLLFTIVLCGLPSFMAAQPSQDEGEAILIRNTPYRFTFTLTESGFLNVLQEPDDIALKIYTDLLGEPKTVPMVRNGNTWTATWVLSDTSVQMVLYAFEASGASYVDTEKLVDNNYGKYYDLLVHNAAGTPVYGAYQARAVSWTGFGNRRPERLRAAAEDVKLEIERYPDNYSARLLLYTIGLRQKEYDDYTRQRVAADIEKTVLTFDKDEALYKFAAAGYRLIGYKEQAADYDQKLIDLNPEGDQAAGKAFEELMSIKDKEKQWNALEGFLTIYPQSRYTEFALTAMVSLAIDRDDSEAYMELGDRILHEGNSPAAASALAGIAGTLSEKSASLPRAEAYIIKALEVIRNTDDDLRPASVSAQGWKNQIAATEARYRDIYGWLLFQQGRQEEALVELRAAAESAHQPGTLYHLARVLKESGNTEESLRMYARSAVYGGEIGDQAYADFETLWAASGRPEAGIESFLEEEQNWLANDYKKRVLALRSIRKAPDFELEEISGGWVRLSDQKGSLVLLCFWATWSQSSLRMLDALSSLSEEYGTDVLFLTVATNRDTNAIDAFMNKYDIAFPVLINDATDKAYDLSGVPTLFLIDSRGNIHYEHRGYKADILDQLIVEIEDLL